MEDLESVGYLTVCECLTKAMTSDDPLAYIYVAVENACGACQGTDYYEINRIKPIGRKAATGCYTSYAEERKGQRSGRKRRKREDDGADSRWDYYSLHAVPKNSQEPELDSAEEIDKILQTAAGVYDNTASGKVVEENLKILGRKSDDLELTWTEIGEEFELPQQTIHNRVNGFKRRLTEAGYPTPAQWKSEKNKPR
jgi:hypothetical protein